MIGFIIASCSLLALFIVVWVKVGDYTLSAAIRRRERRTYTRNGKRYGVRIVDKDTGASWKEIEQ